MKRTKTKYPGVFRIDNERYEVLIYAKCEKRRKADGRSRDQVVRRRVHAKNATEAVAFRARLKAEHQSKKGAQVDSHKPKLLGDVTKGWLEEITTRRHAEDPTQMHLCPSTQARYEASVRDFVDPFFGDFDVSEISKEDIEDWRLNLLDHGYKRETINGHHRVLKQILRTVVNDAASSVPALNAKSDSRTTRKEPNLLTAKELDEFLKAARERWPQHYALILVLFTTTMRISTALALKWDDIDLETMEFVVTRRRSGYGEKAVDVGGVKRDRFGEDTPPLLPEVHQALLAHRSTFNAAQKASGLVFPAEDGRHHYRTLLYFPFQDICHEAKITKRFTPQGCRRTGEKLYGRTAGTRMAMDIAGHRTERMYHHYTPIDAEEKLAAAKAAFGGLTLSAGNQNPTRGPDKKRKRYKRALRGEKRKSQSSLRKEDMGTAGFEPATSTV